MNILWLGIVGFFGIRQRPQHFADGLAKRGHRVLYCPPGNCSGHQTNITDGGVVVIDMPDFIKSELLNYRNIENNRVVLRTHCNNFLNADLLDKDLKIVVQVPYWYPLIADQESHTLLDYLDDFTGFDDLVPYTDKLDTWTKCFCEDATYVATCQKLNEKGGNKAKEIVPNACEFDHFNRAAKSNSFMIPSDIPRQFKKMVGYYGAIHDWFDYELVARLAQACPDYDIVLIGNTTCNEIFKLRGLTNIHILGAKPYEELPSYLNYWDACIVPFRDIPLIHHTDAVKQYEYLASGRSVITTMPNPNKVPNVYSYGNPNEFIKAVRKVAEKPSKGARKKGIEYARQNDWSARIDQLERILEEL